MESNKFVPPEGVCVAVRINRLPVMFAHAPAACVRPGFTQTTGCSRGALKFALHHGAELKNRLP